MSTKAINNPQTNESPIICTEYNGVQVTIVFDENAEGEYYGPPKSHHPFTIHREHGIIIFKGAR